MQKHGMQVGVEVTWPGNFSLQGRLDLASKLDHFLQNLVCQYGHNTYTTNGQSHSHTHTHTTHCDSALHTFCAIFVVIA